MVHERFTIDEETLDAMAENSDYWEKARSFYLQVKDTEVDELTDGQLGWLVTIERSLHEAEGYDFE